MAFRVEPSAQAQQDLNDILEWLLEQGAGEAALRWFFKLEEAIASLSEMPLVIPSPPRARNFHLTCVNSFTDFRPHQYRVLYTIENDMVILLYIRHGRRRRLGEPN
jgi:plasmid stabilization system protein ParE